MPQDVIEFGDRTFKEAIKLMRLLGWALIHTTGALKKRLGYTPGMQEHRDHKMTQAEGSHPQAKETGLRRNQLFPHFDLGFLASSTVMKLISVL